jgi:carbonic anhydrase
MFDPETVRAENNVVSRWSRRNWLAAATGGSALAASGWTDAHALAAALEEETLPPATPQAALDRLFRGNERFATGKSLEIHRDLGRVKAIAAQQKPFAAFLGCADSRVPIEFVFDQGFGDLFVTRIAGNVASSENVGSLEFGTLVLGAKVLFVLGHTACGAVAATVKRDEVPGQISGLFQHIRAAARTAGGDVERAVVENVRNQALVLAESSPVIARLVKEGQLIVAGGVYDLQTGRVTKVEIPAG